MVISLSNIKLCNLCSLCNDIPPIEIESIPNTTELMVITDKPSHEESNLNWRWGDRHSRYTQSLIRQIFNGSLVNYTYLVKCLSEKPLNKKQSSTCINEFLPQEIQMLKPPLILYMGTTMRYFLLNYTEINCPLAFWSSPVTLMNSGKKQEMKFLEYLRDFKNGKVDVRKIKELDDGQD